MIHEIPYTVSVIYNVHFLEMDIGGVVKFFHDDVLECCRDVGFQVKVVDSVVVHEFLSSRIAAVSLASKVRSGGGGCSTDGRLCWIVAYCGADMHNDICP